MSDPLLDNSGGPGKDADHHLPERLQQVGFVPVTIPPAKERHLTNFYAKKSSLDRFDKIAKDHGLDRTELLNAFIELVAREPSPVKIKSGPRILIKIDSILV